MRGRWCAGQCQDKQGAQWQPSAPDMQLPHVGLTWANRSQRWPQRQFRACPPARLPAGQVGMKHAHLPAHLLAPPTSRCWRSSCGAAPRCRRTPGRGQPPPDPPPCPCLQGMEEGGGGRGRRVGGGEERRGRGRGGRERAWPQMTHFGKTCNARHASRQRAPQLPAQASKMQQERAAGRGRVQHLLGRMAI